jgi:hypothetical protein
LIAANQMPQFCMTPPESSKAAAPPSCCDRQISSTSRLEKMTLAYAHPFGDEFLSADFDVAKPFEDDPPSADLDFAEPFEDDVASGSTKN